MNDQQYHKVLHDLWKEFNIKIRQRLEEEVKDPGLQSLIFWDLLYNLLVSNEILTGTTKEEIFQTIEKIYNNNTHLLNEGKYPTQDDNTNN